MGLKKASIAQTNLDHSLVPKLNNSASGNTSLPDNNDPRTTHNLLFLPLFPVGVSSYHPISYLFSLHKFPRSLPWGDKQQLYSHLESLCYPETHLILITIFDAHLFSLPISNLPQKS